MQKLPCCPPCLLRLSPGRPSWDGWVCRDILKPSSPRWGSGVPGWGFVHHLGMNMAMQKPRKNKNKRGKVGKSDRTSRVGVGGAGRLQLHRFLLCLCSQGQADARPPAEQDSDGKHRRLHPPLCRAACAEPPLSLPPCPVVFSCRVSRGRLQRQQQDLSLLLPPTAQGLSYSGAFPTYCTRLG